MQERKSQPSRPVEHALALPAEPLAGLRIVGVCPVYCHPEWRGGGVARTATDLLISLARRGNQVTVISPLSDGDHVFAVPRVTEFEGGQLRLLYSTTARRTKFGTSADGLNDLLTPLLHGPERPDIVHIHSFMSPWTDLAAMLASRARVPYVIQDHGKLTPSILRNRGLSKRMYLLLRGQRLLRRAACVIPSAESVASKIRAWDPKLRVRSCTNGLDPSEFAGAAPARPISSPYVLYLGWLDPRKNPDLLVRSFAAATASGGAAGDLSGEWKLALVGPDSYGMGAKLRALIDELGLGERVVMPGLVRGEAKDAWLRNASIYALPSDGEGLSLAMLEAVASGLPCLLSRECNYPEIEQAGAGRVLALTVADWGAAIGELMGDAARRAEMGSAARRLFLQQHTLDVVGEQLEQILRDAIAGAVVMGRGGKS